jgi:hypothetical protein
MYFSTPCSIHRRFQRCHVSPSLSASDKDYLREITASKKLNDGNNLSPHHQ